MARQLWDWQDMKERHPGAISPSAASSAFVEMTLLNNWVDASAAWGVLSYRLDEDGMVELRGMTKHTAALTSGDFVIATLPAGVRPGVEIQKVEFYVSASIPVVTPIRVLTNGQIAWKGSSGSAIDYLVLDIDFLAEQ